MFQIDTRFVYLRKDETERSSWKVAFGFILFMETKGISILYVLKIKEISPSGVRRIEMLLTSIDEPQSFIEFVGG